MDPLADQAEPSTISLRRNHPTSEQGSDMEMPTSPILPPRSELLSIIADDTDNYNKYLQLINTLESSAVPGAAAQFALACMSKPSQSPQEQVHVLLDAMNRCIRNCNRQQHASINSVVQTAVQSAMHSTSSMRQPALPNRDPTPQEVAARRKNCYERMPKLKKGGDIEAHFRQVRRALQLDGAGLTEGERVDIVRKCTEIDVDVARRMEAHVGGKMYLSVDEYSEDAKSVYKPDLHGYREVVRGKRQKKDQSCVHYLTHIRDLGYQHWVGIPTSEEVFLLIIDTMLPEHRQNVMKSYWMSRAALERSSSARPISFMDLERWAAQSDAELINVRHHRGAANNVEADEAQLKERSDGKGRGKGRGKTGRVHGVEGFQEAPASSFVAQMELGVSNSSDEEIDVVGDFPSTPSGLDMSARIGVNTAPSVRGRNIRHTRTSHRMYPQPFCVNTIMNTRRKQSVPPRSSASERMSAPMPVPYLMSTSSGGSVSPRAAMMASPTTSPSPLTGPAVQPTRSAPVDPYSWQIVGNKRRRQSGSPAPQPTPDSNTIQQPVSTLLAGSAEFTHPQAAPHQTTQGQPAIIQTAEQQRPAKISAGAIPRSNPVFTMLPPPISRTVTAAVQPTSPAASIPTATPVQSSAPVPGVPSHQEPSSSGQTALPSRDPRAALMEPFIHPSVRQAPPLSVLDRPRHWAPQVVQSPISLGAFHVPTLIESLVSNPDGSLQEPIDIFDNCVDSSITHAGGFPHEISKFCRKYQTNVEPLYQPDPLRPDRLRAMEAPHTENAARMITTQDVKHGRAVVTTLTPQVHYTHRGELCLTFLHQDSQDPIPRFNTYVIANRALDDAIEWRRNHPPRSPQDSPQPSSLLDESFGENVRRKAQAAAERRIAARHVYLQQRSHPEQQRVLRQAEQLEQNIATVAPEDVCTPSYADPVAQCNMMNFEVGPLSGSIHNSSLHPLDANAVQGRRPNRAEQL
jgi:hypothetical protein